MTYSINATSVLYIKYQKVVKISYTERDKMFKSKINKKNNTILTDMDIG